VKRIRKDRLGWVSHDVLKPIGNQTKPPAPILNGNQIATLLTKDEAVEEIKDYLSVHPDHIDKTWKYSEYGVGWEGTFLVLAGIGLRRATMKLLIERNANVKKKLRIITTTYPVMGLASALTPSAKKEDLEKVKKFLYSLNGKTHEQMISLHKMFKLESIETSTNESLNNLKIHQHVCYFVTFKRTGYSCNICSGSLDTGFTCYECDWESCRNCCESLSLTYPTSPQQTITPLITVSPSQTSRPLPDTPNRHHEPKIPSTTQDSKLPNTAFSYVLSNGPQTAINNRMVMETSVSISLYPHNYNTTINIHDAVFATMKHHWNNSLFQSTKQTVLKTLSQTSAVDTITNYRLTTNEAAAITYYTTNTEPDPLYRILNSKIQSKEPITDWQPFLWYFISGLKKLPPIATTVYRAWGKPLTREEIEQYRQGEERTWPAFSSTSKRCTLVDSFSPKDKHATWFVLNINEGRDISSLSAFSNEDEILLLPNTRFTVNAAVAKEFKVLLKIPDELHLISMTEIKNNPYDAAFQGNLEILQKYISDHPQTNINAPGPEGNTLIYLASRNGHSSIVKWLIEKGANVNVVQNTGSTPLHAASYRGHSEVCKILLQQKDIRVDIKNKYGKTAKEESTSEIFELFKFFGHQ
jgi:hypothetical protein